MNGRWWSGKGAVLIIAASLSACGSDDETTMTNETPPPPDTTAVDILVVVDDSSDAVTVQQRLIASVGGFVRQLSERLEKPNLHFGVVSSDMGTGGFPVQTCDMPARGQDGVLSTEVMDANGTCAQTYPPVLALTSTSGVDDFVEAVQCKVRIGNSGCGIEQPLEGMLKALTPSTSAVRFVDDTVGHGDGRNQGFARDGSLLVVIFATSEDDCSLADPRLANTADADLGNFSTRCVRLADSPEGYLHRVSRYVDGLDAIRPLAQGRVVFAAIVGAPESVSSNAPLRDVLDLQQMQIRLDSTTMQQLPACQDSDGAISLPGRRLVELAAEIDERGGAGVIGSACASDYDAFAARLLTAVTERANAVMR